MSDSLHFTDKEHNEQVNLSGIITKKTTWPKYITKFLRENKKEVTK